jgi:hypothetical protein
VQRVYGVRLVRAQQTIINQQPREVMVGRFPARGRAKTVAQIKLRSLRSGLRTQIADLSGGKGKLAAGYYVVRANAITRKGKVRVQGSSVVVQVRQRGGIAVLLGPHTAPSVTTGGPSSITESTATVSGHVTASGEPTRFFFEYGPTAYYSTRTRSRSAGKRNAPVNVALKLSRLSPGTVYHYRLVASNCHGCPSGTTYGADATLPTVATTTQQLDAERAVETYEAMQTYFYAANVYPGDTSSLYVTSDPPSGNRYSFLWPFSRALVGTITLAGIPPNLVGGASYGADVADRLNGLSHYWDGGGYESYPPAPTGTGGDKYYDDAAWIGLATAQAYRLTGNPAALSDAKNAFGFVTGGWAGSASFEPGGLYWVNQGVGVGVGNHDRTTNSNAPNAELALLLTGLDPANAASTYQPDATNIYTWVNHYLYNVNNPADPQGPNPNYDATQPALMFDKVRGNNSIDKTLWTYNQGAMIAANVREYQATGQATYLTTAEAIANTALNTFTESQYLTDQPAAFNGIFFRGLLVLYSATSDAALQSRIVQTIQTYANDTWNYYRGADGLFRFPSTSASGDQLLDQGAMLQIYSMLAWSPASYGELP